MKFRDSWTTNDVLDNAVKVLGFAHSDLTTGEMLTPDQLDSVADAVADVQSDLRRLRRGW